MRFDLAISSFTSGVKSAPPYLPPLLLSAVAVYLVRLVHLSIPPINFVLRSIRFPFGAAEFVAFLVLK